MVLGIKPRAWAHLASTPPTELQPQRISLELGVGETGLSHYGDQAGLEHTEIHLPLPPECWLPLSGYNSIFKDLLIYGGFDCMYVFVPYECIAHEGQKLELKVNYHIDAENQTWVIWNKS